MSRIFSPIRLSRRLAGVFAIATLLLGLSADAAHLVLEQHEWCDTHAAIEHVADGAAHADTPSEHQEDGVRVERESLSRDEHSGCRLVTLTREQDAVLARAEQVRAPRAEPLLGRELPAGAPTPRVDRYRLAPKNSPPVL